MTYDRGTLEIMITSFQHENWDYLVSRLVDALTEELEMSIEAAGSMTFQKEVLEQGLEPDNCWWIAHASEVSGRNEIDLDVDPPPDLVLEVDISRSSVNRLVIFAGMRVPEVWRFDGSKIIFHRLRKGKKKYHQVPTSVTFPKLRSQDLQTFLDMRGQKDINAIVRQFRKWVREHLVVDK
jgi:Uma2 family endonuclease